MAAKSTALSQQSKLWRIGHILPGSGGSHQKLSDAMRQSLDEIGLREPDVFLITPNVEPRPDAIADAIKPMLPQIDLLITWGTVATATAKKVAPPSLPIVFLSVGDPVVIGLADSLSRPGGNMTGVTFEAAMETYGKRLQFLKELKPGLSRVAVLGARNDPNIVPAISALDRLASEYTVTLDKYQFEKSADLPNAFDRMREAKDDALVVISGSLTFSLGREIAEFANRYRFPSSGGFKETVAAGGLVSVGPDLPAMSRQGADYVRRIMRGALPGDLPIQQPIKYEVAINLKTAEMLGMTVPPSMLVRADIVIE
ncbi:ABC transporter substrate-binding protein [Methylobacterium nonmethylotrophicum]|uniref:ABC transporter substrate-binding protein n=1 Tax=Methylobacterium nonmethylotrophicum TaxID=1141884 RepID=UPI00247ACDEE|nr:ABC transporter substrate-binding protein [Methylobacterium nonmethylotrophicum]